MSRSKGRHYSNTQTGPLPTICQLPATIYAETWSRGLGSASSHYICKDLEQGFRVSFQPLYICRDLEQGVRVGFQRGSPLKSAQANLGSASEHPKAIEEIITKECIHGRMLGPFVTMEGQDWVGQYPKATTPESGRS